MNMSPGGMAPEQSPFRFFGGELTENPFPVFASMRSMAPLVPFSSGGSTQSWLVTRMDEAVQVLKDKRFTIDRTRFPNDNFFPQAPQETPSDRIRLFGRSMISVDEPDHKRLRGLVSKAFTPRYIEGLRPHVQAIADELLDRVQDQGSMDLVHDYAYPLPINVISDMLGVPSEMRAQMQQWSADLANSLPGAGSNREDSFRHIREFAAYVEQLVAEKRQRPQDDLISQLIRMEQEGDHLNEDELLSTVGLLIFAGHETTSNLIGIGVLTLLDHPGQLEKLKADPRLVPSAVEEFLRFNGPVLVPAPRFALEDVEIGGQVVHRGDIIITVLASANHDESQFTDPESLDIVRSLNRHIAFGQGIHVCLGAPLARLEGDIAFTTLLKRMPNLRLNVPRATITWRGGLNLRGLTSLPVAF